MTALLPAVLIIFSYLLGSIPSAYIAGRALKGIDIRKVGDGNVGAANAYHEIGRFAGWIVLVVDVCKGAAAVLITQIFASQLIVFLAGLAVIVGHTWPLYIGFKGGRGEATTAGVLVALLPQAMLSLLGIAIIPFAITRNTMVLGAILFAPLWLGALIMGASGALISYSAALPCLVGISHFVTTRHLAPGAKQKGRYMRYLK